MSTKKAKDLVLDQVISQEVRPRFVSTSANFSPDVASNFEWPVGASMTVPDMVMDLQLMLNRRANGFPVTVFDAGYSESDYPDFFKMDEFELSEYRLNLAEDMKRMTEELHAASKALEKKQEEERKKEEEERKKVVTQQPSSGANGSPSA